MSTLRGRLPTGSVTEPEVAVFVSGVASMGLEILAGRLIAPQFGSSIFTWGSIIGVFLAALSLGYHRGGQRAAESATPERLVWLLLWTAAYVAGVVFAGELLIVSTVGLPLPSRFASLPAITLLFGPPTYFLGFISPYAAELSEKREIGAASGHVYAVGTVGSIIGAFGTTFVLIPELSVELVGFVFGALLVGTAGWLAYPRDGTLALRSLGVAALLVLAAGSGSLGVAAEGRVVYQTQTAYQELEVIETGDTRTLYLDGQQHSAMDTADPTRHVFNYTRYFHLPYLFTDDPDEIDRVLFIGGGGMSGPKRFAEEYNATIDVAEIDPEVIRVSREYFAVEESDQLRIHRADGRQFLRDTDRKYDLIVLDAYKKDKVPFQLTTVEFFRLAESRLTENGILFANLISAPTGPAAEFYRAEHRTMSQVFPHVYTFPTVGGPAVQNVEVVATRSDRRVTEAELRAREQRRSIGIDLSHEVRQYRYDEVTESAPLLRDDRAPVDSLLDSMTGQRYVIEQAPDTNRTAGPGSLARAAG